VRAKEESDCSGSESWRACGAAASPAPDFKRSRADACPETSGSNSTGFAAKPLTEESDRTDFDLNFIELELNYQRCSFNY
jgi:hypothetical protein